MIKHKIALLLLLCTAVSYGQNDTLTAAQKRSEIKIDGFNLLFLSKFSISFERQLNTDFSTGITFIKTSEKFIAEIMENNGNAKVLDVQIIPYFRYKLHEFDANSSLYLEFIAAYNSGRFTQVNRISDGEIAFYARKENKFQDVAIGGSLGYKQYIFKDVCIDLNVGFARNMFSKNSQELIPRVGFNVGYRF